jgi:hypothetical protein
LTIAAFQRVLWTAILSQWVEDERAAFESIGQAVAKLAEQSPSSKCCLETIKIPLLIQRFALTMTSHISNFLAP